MDARLVRDINPDFGSSSITETTNVDGVLYFNAFDGEDYGLWQSDGTSAGTKLLSSFEDEPADTDEYIAVENRLLFTNFENDTGTELWVSDGTEEGTEVVADIFDDGSSNPQQLTAVGDEAYFLADSDGDEINELWKSDGTEDGTESVLTSEDEVTNLTDVDGTLYFTQGELAGELWKIDEESGEAEIVLENAGTNTISALTDVDGTLYFTRNDYELWQVDSKSGVATETEEFVQSDDNDGEGIANLTEVGNTLYFSFDDGEIGRELYQSRGAADNTGLVKDLSPNQQDAGKTINLSSGLGQLTDADGTLYFTADRDGDDEQELWTSDGTNANTQILAEFEGNVVNPVNANGIVYFGVDLNSEFTGINEVWQSDGTKDGTVLANDLSSRDFVQAEVANGNLYYPAEDSDFDWKLWTIDNTSDVTRLFDPDSGSSLYTTSETEISTLIAESDYESRGVAFNGADSLSGQPVYQFINEDAGSNLYTIDEAERTEFTDLDGFEADGTAFYAYETELEGTIPIYRFQDLTTDAHYLTGSASQKQTLEANDDFASDGIAFYALPEIDLA